jgi:hypothetical protein
MTPELFWLSLTSTGLLWVLLCQVRGLSGATANRHANRSHICLRLVGQALGCYGPGSIGGVTSSLDGVLRP